MKKFSCLILSLLMCLCVLSFGVNAQGINVVDEADLLTDKEETELQNTISQIRDEYQFEVVVLTVDFTDGKSAEAFADDYYDDNGYGLDSENSGVLFLVDMGNRNWHISTTGRGITLISDAELDYIEYGCVQYLSQGDYFYCLSEFVSICDQILEYDSRGESFIDSVYSGEYSYYTDEELDFFEEDVYFESDFYTPQRFNFFKNAMIALVVGFVIALVIVLNMKSKLKTVRPKSGASDYVVAGSMNITRSDERFLYRNVTRTPRQQNNSNGRPGGRVGGGGVHIGSSGTSHGGRGGSF